jgi:hypothetical protein
MRAIVGKGGFSLPKTVACTSKASDFHPPLKSAMGHTIAVDASLPVTAHVGCRCIVIIVWEVQVQVDA